MLFDSGRQFLAQKHKRITLMGMSNIGKTTLAASMPADRWFHYSVDYRLATAYLKEAIVDVLKKEMMTVPYLARHLREDLICIDLNVSLANLRMVSHYLGKVGRRADGGLSMSEFEARQERHRRAEVQAMLDIPEFIAKGVDIYGYDHFINDSSGSLCEIIDPDVEHDTVLKAVTDNTVLVYLQADARQEQALVERAVATPKPLYYRPRFLEAAAADYVCESRCSAIDDADPDAFVRWVFKRLLEARRPRYERIARFGYTLSARAVSGLSEAAFLERLAQAIDDRNAELSAPPRLGRTV